VLLQSGALERDPLNHFLCVWIVGVGKPFFDIQTHRCRLNWIRDLLMKWMLGRS